MKISAVLLAVHRSSSEASNKPMEVIDTVWSALTGNKFTVKGNTFNRVLWQLFIPRVINLWILLSISIHCQGVRWQEYSSFSLKMCLWEAGFIGILVWVYFLFKKRVVCGKLIWTENCSDLRVLEKILFEVSSFSNSWRTRLDWILLGMYISFVYIIKVLCNVEGEITREVFNELSRL